MQLETTPQKKANRLAMLKKLLNPQKPLYKFVKPEVLKQSPLNWHQVMEWHRKRSDLTDFFNYGFNEHTFHQFINKVQHQHEHNSNEIQKCYLDRLNNPAPPFRDAKVLTDQTPLDYGGLNVPFDPRLLEGLDWDPEDYHLLDSILFLPFEKANQYHWSNENILHSSEALLKVQRAMKENLQRDVAEAAKEERTMYDFEDTADKITNYQKRKGSFSIHQNIQNNYNVLCNTQVIVTPVPGRNPINLATSGQTIQDNLTPQLFAPLLLEQKGLALVETHKEDDKKKRRRKDKRIKKEKKDKKDKKRRKHKHSKKHKRVKEDIAIDFEHMDESEQPYRQNRQHSESESSYLPSHQTKSPHAVDFHQLVGLTPQQGNQGAAADDHDEAMPDQQSQVKPVCFTPIRSPSPDKLYNDGRRRPTKEGAWPMNQIQGILQGQATKGSRRNN